MFFISKVNGQKFKDKFDSKELTRNNQSYFFDNMKGLGLNVDKLPTLSCSETEMLKETNSIWMKWSVEKDGLLAFTIAPVNENDDIDFVVFKQNNKNLEVVRCMASGSNLISKKNEKENCKELTGLSFDERDSYESEGCSEGDNNFLKYLTCSESDEYFLLVNNYDSHAGFTISFEGNTIFNTDKRSKTRESKDNIKIYPNPASDYLYVSTNFEVDDKLDVRIYNSQGNLISKERLIANKNVAKLNIQALVSGSYFLQINQGDQKITHSFIKS
jgi:hypothetical protein